jgi:hypothetical protein
MTESDSSELVNGLLLNDCLAKEKKVVETCPTDQGRIGYTGKFEELLYLVEIRPGRHLYGLSNTT